LVADDGVGLPEEIDISQTSTIGLRMAYNFILRLKGDLSLIRTGGTRFRIDFPKQSSY
jgi:two-component sensor histidine kinase